MYFSYYGYSTNGGQTKPLTPIQFLDKEVVPFDKTKPFTLYMKLKAPAPKLLSAVLKRISEHTVECLDLSNNDLTDSHAKIIAEAVKTARIKRVILTGNSIQDDGAVALSKAMKKVPGLLLDLNNNRIGPLGAKSVVRAFIACNVKKLDLSNNQLGDDGAEIIADQLQRKTGALEHLILKHNGITDNGDKILAERVPLSVAITYRVKVVSFMEGNPVWSVFLCVILLPLIFIVFPLLRWCIKSEIELQGCKFEQKRRVIET